MRKRLAVILSMILLIGATPTPVGAVETAHYGTKDAKQVISGLGILDEGFVKAGDTPVTRAEFILMVLTIVKIPVNMGDKIYFNDVKQNTKGFAAINTAVSLGYISGYQGSFRPNDTITVLEAATILLNVAGYGEMAKQSNSYISYAQQNGLLDVGLSLNSGLTRGAFCEMLYQALDMPVYQATGVNDGYLVKDAKNTTFAKYFFDIEEKVGIINATVYSAIDAQKGVADGRIRIGATEYDNKYTKADQWLGYNVRAFVDVTDESDPVVVLAVPYKMDVLKIEAKDILSKSSKTSVYYNDDSDKERFVHIDPVADVIYNGVADAEFNLANLLQINGFITLIDNDNDSVTEVVLIDNYDTMFISAVSGDGTFLVNYYSEPASFSLEDIENIIMHGDIGQTKVSDIKSQSVVSIRRPVYNADKYIFLDVSTASVTGVIEEINSDDDKITVGGVEYEVAKSYLDALAAKDFKAKKLTVKTEGTFYLDVFGRIAGFIASADVNLYGFLKKAAKGDGISNIAEVRILGTDQDWHTYKIADKVKVNDTTESDIFKVRALSPNGVDISPQVVEYQLNGNGEISILYTAVQSDDYTTDRFRYKDINMIYRSPNASFDSKIYLSSATVTFHIPTTDADSKRYSDAEISSLDEVNFSAEHGGYSDWGQYAIRAYNCDMFGVTSILYRADSINNIGNFSIDRFVYKEMTQQYDSGNPSTIIKGAYGVNSSASVALVDGAEVYDSNGNNVGVSGLKQGDVLKLYFNAENNVYKAQITFRAQDAAQKIRSGFGGSLHDESVALYGVVTNIDADTGRLLLDDGLTEFKSLKYNRSDMSLYTYEARANNDSTIRTGNFADIRKGDYIYTTGRQSQFTFIIVYREN